LKIHTAIIKPSLGYRLAPPKVRILPPIDHPCVNQESGLVHMEENGFWNRARNTVNPLEHISIALRKEFRLV
jgi:ubiquitin-protein ligase